MTAMRARSLTDPDCASGDQCRGDYSTYVYSECRGQACRDAYATYKREWRATTRIPITDNPDDDWRLAAACRDEDPNLFFPDHATSTSRPGPPDTTELRHLASIYAPARTICDTCPVAAACLEEELAFGYSNQYGMRGGLDPNERRALIRARNRETRTDLHAAS
jgi:WhiB family redox-sensing transcriptional regulator